MAAFTTQRAGSWTDTNNLTQPWTEEGTPGNGDTVTLSHNVTVDAATTIGTSPTDTTTMVVTVNNGATLTVAEDIVFTVRGNISLLGNLTLALGSSLIFDSTQDGGSNTQYTMALDTAAYTNVIAFNGTTAKHCKVQGIGASNKGQISGYIITGSFTASYTDFKYMGTTTGVGVKVYGDSGYQFNVTNCTFDTCAEVHFSSNTATLSRYFNYNVFTNTTATPIFNNNGAWTAGTAEFIGNVFDILATINYLRGFTIEKNVFLDGYVMTDPTAAQSTTVMRNNFIRNAITRTQAAFCDITDCYFLLDHVATGGGYRAISANASNQDVTVSGIIFEPADSVSGDIIVFPACGTGKKQTVKDCLGLPTRTTGVGFGKLCSFLTTDYDVAVDILHNTWPCTDIGEDTIVNVGETVVGHAGMVANFKSNLAWTPTGKTAGVYGVRINNTLGTVSDLITPSGVDYNWGWGLATGNVGGGWHDLDTDAATTPMFTTVPTNSHGGSGDPQFVDSTRNLAKWSLSLGGADSIAGGLAALVADVEKIEDLIAWVRDGFRVQNQSLRNAGHDGDTIGACDAVAVLTIPDSVHAHKSSNLVLSPGSGESDLLIDDSMHAHVSDNLTLTMTTHVVQTLTIPDSVHAHTSDLLTLTSQGIVDLAAATTGTARYDVGDLVRVIGSWHDPFNGDVAIDPTVVKCAVTTPLGVTTVYVYGTDAAMKKESTGVYYMDLSITEEGIWYYRWYSTGTAQAAAEKKLIVREQMTGVV